MAPTLTGTDAQITAAAEAHPRLLAAFDAEVSTVVDAMEADEDKATAAEILATMRGQLERMTSAGDVLDVCDALGFRRGFKRLSDVYLMDAVVARFEGGKHRAAAILARY